MVAKNGPVKVARPVKLQPVLPPSIFEGERIVVILPLPDRRLHPNGDNSLHWTQLGRLVSAAKQEAQITTMHALKGAHPLWDKAVGFRRVYLTTRARADKDNLAGWTKAYVDGIANAGVVVNDCVITWQGDEIEADRTMPRVEIELRKA
jgi:hypothetical protein